MGNKHSSSGKKGGGGGRPGPKPTLDSSGGVSHKEETDAAVFYRKGLGYLATQRYEDAVTSFNEALKLRRMLNQEATAEYAAASLNYAVAISHTGGGDVLDSFEQAFQMFERLDGTESPVFALGVADLGRFLVREGRLSEGVAKLKEALQRLEALADKGATDVRRDLAEALLADGQAEQALEMCSALLNDVKDNIARGRVLLTMSKASEALGKRSDAIARAREAILSLNKHDPNEPQWLTRQKAQAHLDAAEQYLEGLGAAL